MNFTEESTSLNKNVKESLVGQQDLYPYAINIPIALVCTKYRLSGDCTLRGLDRAAQINLLEMAG